MSTIKDSMHKHWSTVQPNIFPLHEMRLVEKALADLGSKRALDFGVDLTAMAIYAHDRDNADFSFDVVSSHGNAIARQLAKIAGNFKFNAGNIHTAPDSAGPWIKELPEHLSDALFDFVRILSFDDRFTPDRRKAVVDLLVPRLAPGAVIFIHPCSAAAEEQLHADLSTHDIAFDVQRSSSVVFVRTAPGSAGSHTQSAPVEKEAPAPEPQALAQEDQEPPTATDSADTPEAAPSVQPGSEETTETAPILGEASERSSASDDAGAIGEQESEPTGTSSQD